MPVGTIPTAFSIDVLREPRKGFTITHLAHDAAHKDLHGAHIGVSEADSALAGGEISEPQVVAELLF